jgi:hypothetical protein
MFGNDRSAIFNLLPSSSLHWRQLYAGDHDGWVEDVSAPRSSWQHDERSRLSFGARTDAVRADKRLVWFARLRRFAANHP